MQHRLIVQQAIATEMPSSSRVRGSRELQFPSLDTVVLDVKIPPDLINAAEQLYSVFLARGEWLLVDLAPVRIANKRSAASFVGALEMVAPTRFCLVATSRSRWVTRLLPHLAAPVTFGSMGDAVQMMVLANHGYGSEWGHTAPGNQSTIDNDETLRQLPNPPLEVISRAS